MQKTKIVFIGTLLAILGSLAVFSQTHATPIQWPVKTDGLEVNINSLTANAHNNISLINCSNNPATHPNLSEHFGDTYSTTTTSNDPPKFPCISNETYDHPQAAADGTFYTYYIAIVNGQPQDRIAAIKNNQILWSTDITSNTMCSSSSRSAPYSISIGPNGNVYTIISSHTISNCATYVAGFNGKTGAQIFKQYIANRIPPNSSTTSWTYAGRLWTYEDKILLVDTNGMERKFSYSGAEDVTARYQFPNVPNTGAYGGALLANENGRIFVVYRTAWGCYPNVDGTYIRYHDTDGTSGTSSLNLGCNNPDYAYIPTHDGNLAAYGYSGSLRIAHMTDSNHSISDFPIPQGYTQARILSYWEDTGGKRILVRQLTDASGLRTITVDDVDIPNHTLTNIASINPNITGYNFGVASRRADDISDSNLYLPLCHTNCNSSADRAANTWVHRIQLPNFGVPIKDTSQLADTMGSDVDNDSLTLAQEVSQGTSDHNTDTDEDGLSDYKESVWNVDRDDLFCGTECAYPTPNKKDLYVEVDWMKDPATNESFKPTSSQLNQVKAAYAAKGITAHFDTGEYGGGNELPSYAADLYFTPTATQVDFYDYKNGSLDGGGISPNFNSSRYHIWHYMISGYQYHETSGSSGVSYAGDDDSFISYGLIEHNPLSFSYADFDDAIAGTIIHELGHSSCLSHSQAYTAQSPNCIYSGIDTSGPATYASSMNYGLQMYIVDYSTGANGAPADHDDWSAINDGMDDFISSSQGAETNGKKMPGRMRIGITIQKARELRRQGRLGLIKRGGVLKSLLPARYRTLY